MKETTSILSVMSLSLGSNIPSAWTSYISQRAYFIPGKSSYLCNVSSALCLPCCFIFGRLQVFRSIEFSETPTTLQSTSSRWRIASKGKSLTISSCLSTILVVLTHSLLKRKSNKNGYLFIFVRRKPNTLKQPEKRFQILLMRRINSPYRGDSLDNHLI